MYAGQNFTTAVSNDAFGYQALGSLTAGGRNVAIGQSALSSLTQTGNTDNVAVGHAAGRNLSVTATTNYVAENVVIGGLANAGDTGNGADALNNVYIGARSGYVATTAKGNTFVGRRPTGYAVTTGDGNILIGSNAGDNLTTGGYNTYIGYTTQASAKQCVTDEIVLQAGSGAVTGGGTETIRIGVDSDYIVNDFGENATWTHSSDRRIKKNM